MNLVLDTNVWLSAIFWDGEANKLIERVLSDNKIKIFISREIISEINEILNREEKFDRFFEDKRKDIEDLIRVILSKCELIEVNSEFDVIKQHKSDNIFLELANDCNANYIISYNKHLLNLIEFKQIRILSPTDFLKIL
jgi:putative PIN family toxin of toxin-antitoxin system